MGIKNLKTFIKRHSKINSPEILSDNATLCIDGNGWSYYIYRNLDRKYGGNYTIYDKLIRSTVRSIQNAGLQLIVFWDGKQIWMKENCYQVRKSNKHQRWQNLQNFCLDSAKYKNEDFPKPPLLNDQLRATLTNLGIKNIDSDSEADLSIATYVNNQPNCYAYGDDTDFFAFGIPYIQFEDLVIKKKTASAVIWSETKLQEYFKLNKFQMIELAIMLGNDYTGSLIKNEFKQMGSTIDEKITYIQENNKQLITTDKNLKIAMDFSRDLYNFNCIKKYPNVVIEESKSKNHAIEKIKVINLAVDKLCQIYPEKKYLEELRKLPNQLGKKHKNVKLVFENTYLAKQYQLYCKDLNSEINPKDIYDGHVFHHLLTVKNKIEKPPEAIEKKKLPIENYKKKIVAKIKENRVTIIQGETGCGKSSKIPEFILEDNPNCKMMIAQPRRIACVNLMNYSRSTLGENLVGMRLGMGVREEKKGCKMWYVTTGYLLQLMGHNLDYFKTYSHIIVDEAHERSVDADLLCLFIKRLMAKYTDLKVIIMSATLRADVYINYFQELNKTPIEPLFVGGRRFVNKILYTNQIIKLLPAQKEPLEKLNSNLSISGCQKIQMTVTKNLIRYIGGTYSGNILVFLPGIKEIIEMIEYFDNLQTVKNYCCIPVHSDIPFEDQKKVFENTPEDTLKIILATNSAESSITFPDINHVICFGTFKQVNPEGILIKQWISKDSAKQRAGRTGRVRPGFVYRIYSEKRFKKFKPYQEPDIKRVPLDSTVLYIKNTLDEDLYKVMENTVEPISKKNINSAVSILFNNGILKKNTSDSGLTYLGKLSSNLPIDYKLGKLIALGKIFGCENAAIALAAAISLPSLPFRKISPLVFEPNKYNKLTKVVYSAKVKFDNGNLSQPIMYLNILKKWLKVNKKHRVKWACSNQLAHQRMYEYERVYKRICTSLDINPEFNKDQPTIELLQFLLTYSFSENIITGEKYSNPVDIRVDDQLNTYMKKLFPKLELTKRTQELWSIKNTSNIDIHQLADQFCEVCQIKGLNFYGVYFSKNKTLDIHKNGVLIEKSGFKKNKLQKLLTECLNKTDQIGAIMIFKSSSVILWTFDIKITDLNLDLDAWEHEKAQVNNYISKNYEHIIDTLAVISNGNYKQQFNYVNDQKEKKSTHLEIPFTKWSLNNTAIIMPKISVLQTAKHNKTMWMIAPSIVYSGKNKSIAFCNHATIIKDLKFLEKALFLRGKQFDYKTLKENDKYLGQEFITIFENIFDDKIEYKPDFAKKIMAYLFPKEISNDIIDIEKNN